MTDLNEPIQKALSRRAFVTGTLSAAATLSTVAVTETVLSNPAFAFGAHTEGEGSRT
jgi:hypothetical protein